ncbi:fructosamine kinase family protein [soil metagenome]
MTRHDSSPLVDWVAAELGSEVVRHGRLGGGDVAESYRLELADGRQVFAKTHRDPPPGFFTTEAWGLAWLREAEAGAAAVPEVLAVSDGPASGGTDGSPGDEPPALVLEWIEEGRSSGTTEADLGRSLAELHRAGAPCFGREDRRTTGSRALPNDPCDTWVEFFATRRLLPLARLAHDGGALPESTVADLESVAGRLDALGGAVEPPARLHGDLWAGNRLVDRNAQNWLIDPAAHGGHREFDLAMMRLFGGFGSDCFSAYHDTFPLAPDWEERVPLHQLAPLTVHAIKFGGGYVGATRRALDELV